MFLFGIKKVGFHLKTAFHVAVFNSFAAVFKQMVYEY